MTNIYFIRHAESDYSVLDSRTRPLTPKGLADCHLVTEFLRDKDIDAVLSSPYQRAVDTVRDFAEKNGLVIQTIEGFREVRSDSGHRHRTMDFPAFMKKVWTDFDYRLADGETLGECQERNVAALQTVLSQYEGQNVVIGTHGIALSTILNYYDNTYGYEDFMAMNAICPWVVKMSFDNNQCVKIMEIDLFGPLDKPPPMGYAT